MVVVHRGYGFRFVIYTLDHEPAHVYITGAGHAKINLLSPGGRPEIVFSASINRADMRRLLAEVTACRDDFLREWERIHGRRD